MQYHQGYPTAPSYMYAPSSGSSNPYAQTLGVAPYQLTRPQNSRFGSMREVPVTHPYDSSYGPTVSMPSENRRGRQRKTERLDHPSEKKPLKSAMKKTKRPDPHRSQTLPAMEEVSHLRLRRSETGHDDELVRTRTISDPNRTRANQFSRPRSRSQATRHFTPHHVFVGFNGSSGLHLGNICLQVTVDDIRERVLPIWSEGVVSQSYLNDTNEYKVQFVGNPWTTTGPLRLFALKMILELFVVLWRQSFSCSSVIDTGHPLRIPRLVFKHRQPPDSTQEPHFFLLSLSNSRRKMEIIDLRESLCLVLVESLRKVFPRAFTTAKLDENEVYTIEWNRDFNQPFDLVIATILEQMSLEGYKLDATIPLSRSGLWGLLQGRREIWVFRTITHGPW